ncbi:hypothetical protein MJA45_02035 [Paenibacillus aurantius]|uniref:Uncharacterized protein n=1 Tax=Paenibacillus aurantius TaxID=2918900 RepID=A0AA96LER1_9BACL|nr:hypothetical protein [Paenibacillus aurantius]WNQ11858.1 hypothetical protein MJA45_02035 [Paenibacillus aurantius]
MKMVYEWKPEIVDIKETENGKDIEFSIRVIAEAYYETMKAVQQVFEENDVITDVFLYTFPQHEYRVIVRKDYYEDFILQLLKHRLLTKAEWKEETH